MVATCEWDKYPVGTVDVRPGWTVQSFWYLSDCRSRGYIEHPVYGFTVMSGEATASETVSEDFTSVISGEAVILADSNFIQPLTTITGEADSQQTVEQVVFADVVSGEAVMADVSNQLMTSSDLSGEADSAGDQTVV